MPISDLRPPDRSLIGWLGGVPPIEVYDVFKQRQFALIEFPPPHEFDGQGIRDGIRAAILVQHHNQSNRSFAEAITAEARDFLEAGCAFVVRPLAKGRITALQTLQDLKLPAAGFDKTEKRFFGSKDGDDCPVPHVHLFPSNATWHEIANFISSFDAGLRPNSQLKPSGFTFSGERLMLIQRAFSDCRSVHFTPMSEAGKSGVDVYQVHAELVSGHLGPWPQPYFVKLGERTKILREYENYQKSVHPYLPYHLAPRLKNDRCCLGAESGIIVGDFVDESEGLLDCSEQARGVAPLSYLFDSTLQSWYRNATSGLEHFGELLAECLPHRISEQRLGRASELGATMGLPDFRQLIAALPNCEVLMGPIHGDLHARNVRVRKAEAILIDFFAQDKRAPVIFDLAALEVSLLVDGFQDDPRLQAGASRSQEWITSILPLYAGDPVLADTNVCHPKDQSNWFYASTRIIRRHARTMEQDRLQYAAALVTALLRKASKDYDAPEPEATRRAVAILLAERLASTIRDGGRQATNDTR